MINATSLLAQLNNTGLQNKDNPLYQFLKFLISTLQDTQTAVADVATTPKVIVNNIPKQNLIFDDSGGDEWFIPSPSIINNIINNTTQNLLFNESVPEDAILSSPAITNITTVNNIIQNLLSLEDNSYDEPVLYFPSPLIGNGAFVLQNSPTLLGAPLTPTPSVNDNSTKIASTAFVTTAINNAIAAVNPAVAVQAATTGILPNTPTYNNGVSGIGATITAGVTNTTLVVDGYTPLLNDRILVKNESGGLGASRNGVYFVSQLAALGLAWILTRALDYDQPSDINNTGAIPVVNGTSNTNTSWLLTSTVNTVGTDSLTYVQFSINPSTIVTGSGTAGKLPKWSASSALTDSVMVESGGFIGIGTAPSAILHAKGATPVVLLESNNTSGAQFEFKNTVPQDWVVGMLNNVGITRFSIYDVTNSREALSIDTSGNVGVVGDIRWGNNTGFGLLGSDGVRFVSYTTAGGVVIGSLAGALNLARTVTSYNGIATAGNGIPAIYASGRITAQTTVPQTITSYLTTADSSFLVVANFIVTAYTSGVLSMICSYTDESNTAHSLTLAFNLDTGTMSASVSGTGTFAGVAVRIRAKSGTTITLKTSSVAFSGTYNAEAEIIQIA